MESITLFFQRLVVRDNLEECIGFLISHWNVSNVLAKYATPSWESDDRSRCFVLYSMNSELSWSDSPELGCSHSLVLLGYAFRCVCGAVAEAQLNDVCSHALSRVLRMRI